MEEGRGGEEKRVEGRVGEGKVRCRVWVGDGNRRGGKMLGTSLHLTHFW